MKKNNKDIKFEIELNERFDAVEKFNKEWHLERKTKTNKILSSILLFTLDITVILVSITIAVSLATKIALMKATYILVTASWYKSFIFQEYSITLGALSILFSYMFYLFFGGFYSKFKNLLYEGINKVNYRSIAKYDEKTKTYNTIKIK